MFGRQESAQMNKHRHTQDNTMHHNYLFIHFLLHLEETEPMRVESFLFFRSSSSSCIMFPKEQVYNKCLWNEY